MPIKLPSMLRKINRGFLGPLLLLGTSVGLSVAFCEVIIRVVAPQPPSWMPVYRPYGPPPITAWSLTSDTFATPASRDG